MGDNQIETKRENNEEGNTHGYVTVESGDVIFEIMSRSPRVRKQKKKQNKARQSKPLLVCHDIGKSQVSLSMIMHSSVKASMFHGGHAVDHGKSAMEVHDIGKDSMITPMV